MSTQNKDAATILGTTIFLAWLGLGLYGMFFKTTNIISPIGTDKVGRQVLISSLDATFKKMGGKDREYVSSEWRDTNFFQRFFIQEPMRTTLIMLPDTAVEAPSLADIDTLLESPVTELLGPMVTLRDDAEETRAEVLTRLVKHKFDLTFEGYLSAAGFYRFEVRYGPRTIFAKDLAHKEGGAHIVGGD